MADGRVVIDVDLNDKGAQSGISGLKSAFSGIGDSAKSAGATVKNLVTSLGLVKLASAGFNVLKNSISGAVSRLDTLNNSDRVFENMGFTAGETAP